MEKQKRKRMTKKKSTLATSTVFHKRKFPRAYDNITESELKTTKSINEQKKAKQAVKFDNIAAKIAAEMKSL